MVNAGVVPNDPRDCRYTPRQLYWMSEAIEESKWAHTAMIAMEAHNSNGYLKKLAKYEDFLPETMKRLRKTSGKGGTLGDLVRMMKPHCKNVGKSNG